LGSSDDGVDADGGMKVSRCRLDVPNCLFPSSRRCCILPIGAAVVDDAVCWAWTGRADDCWSEEDEDDVVHSVPLAVTLGTLLLDGAVDDESSGWTL
jgi:hypothetical protein